MNRTKAKIVTKDINEALVSVGRKHNLVLTVDGGTTYSSDSISMRIKGYEPDDTGTIETDEMKEFKFLSKLYGLKPDDLGREFEYKGRQYKITGLKARRKKFPISVVETETNRMWKFPASIVTKALEG